MLSEDYFGFVGLQSKSSRSIYRKATQRTQLSEQKVNSREKAIKQEEQGIEKLKIKYDEIMKKTGSKKHQKRQKKIQQSYYHAARIKYFHYNDEGYDSEQKRLKKRVEEKAKKAYIRFKRQSLSKDSKRPSSLENVQTLKSNQIPIPRLISEDEDISELQKQSHLKKSYSDSNLLRESSRYGRSLRKMKNQERDQYDKEKKSQKFDDYKMSSLKHPSLQSKSQVLLVNSIPRSQSSNFVQMVSKVGLQSKVEDKIEPKKRYPHSSYEKSRNTINFSSDYQAIKKMQAQKSVVKLLIDSKKYLNEEEKVEYEDLYIQKINSKVKVPESQDDSSLSKMIKKSGEMFMEKKKSQIKFNRADRQYNFTGTFNFTPSSQKKGDNKKYLSPNESSLMYGQNRSKMVFNKSKLSKISSNKQILQQKVQDIESVRSQEFMDSQIENQNSVLIKLESKQGEKSGCDFSVLLESVRQWREFEEKTLYSKLIWKNQQSLECNHIIQKVYKHLDIINEIVDFVEMTTELYEKHQQSHWMEFQSFLIFKKFYQERVKIVSSLKEAKSSCFKCQKALIDSYSLLKYRKNSLIKQIANCLQEGNILLWKALNSFYWQVKQFHTNSSFLSLDPFKKKDLSQIMKRLNEQCAILFERIDDLQGSLDENEEKDRQLIHLRCCKIMELAFLLSCLEGRQVTVLEKEDESEDFQFYCHENYGKFKETVLYFN